MIMDDEESGRETSPEEEELRTSGVRFKSHIQTLNEDDIFEEVPLTSNHSRVQPKNNNSNRRKEISSAELNLIIPDSKKAPQLFAAISVSTGCITYGICMAYTSSAIPSMLKPNETSPLNIAIGDYEATWMGSLLALGALFGSLSAVFLMDAVGRKASLLAFSVMSLFIGWTLLMAASQIWQIYTGRFLLGFGAGLEITISPVYIHEICRPVLRDICGSLPQVFSALGILICYIMGRNLEWNWLSLASCVFLFPFTFGLYFIPESPPWLVCNDEEDLAFKSLVLVRGEEYDATIEMTRMKERLAYHNNNLHALLYDNYDYQKHRGVEETTGHRVPPVRAFSHRDVFHKSVVYPFLVILILNFLHQFSGQGVMTFYTGHIFREAQSSLDPKDCALIIGVTYFLSSILGLILKKHVGRRVLLLISEFGMAASQLSLGTYFYYTLNDKNQPLAPEIRWIPLPLIIIFTVAFNIGIGSLTWVITTEILPVQSSKWTHAIANMTSNLWWFVVTKTFKDIYYNCGPYVPFYLYGIVCIFGFVFIYIFLPETQGKTQEDTARSFEGVHPLLKRIGCKNFCKILGQCGPLNKLKNARRHSNHIHRRESVEGFDAVRNCD
ncbi:facilitated trehalose transporter Tret1 [Lepeophtheirus salmonis]|uniref:Major facilitator superfamily (MFS) profile domain-containing protein n=1 Tax=Lepeophtheirus salmonis TaxID=72036 RepID=A0A0K2U7Y2_LEPSM|nr:facilitated trehalose transporter Tret1-like [Lepeophtheirus salmonis]